MILIFRTNHDLPTQYLYAFMGKAAQSIYNRIELNGRDANRENFEWVLKNYEISAVFGGGHGDYSKFGGWENEIVLRACENDDLLSGKIVYLLSCRTGRELGPSSIDKGARAFIGYAEDFVFAIDERYLDRPLDDPLAKSFFEPAIEVMYSIARGESADLAWKRSQDRFNAEISKWMSSTAPEAPYIISLLIHDRDYQVFIGEEGATIIPPVAVPAPSPIILIPIILIAGALLLLR